MKIAWIIGIVALGLLLTLGALQAAHVIDIKWQMLSILVAGLIAPFKFIFSHLKSNKEKIDSIKSQHETIRAQENQYQAQLESRIKEREDQIGLLNKQINVLNSRVSILEQQSKNVDQEIDNMTVDEKKEKFKDLFGQ